MEVELVKLEKKFIDSVLEIEKSSFPDPWNRDFFEKELSLDISKFYVAKIGSKILGYGGFWKIGNDADIVNLAVSPDFRNKGIGKKILAYLIEEAKKSGVEKIFLEVRVTNSPAQKLYASFGFKAVGKRAKYYCNEDAVIMEKIINEI